MSSPRSSSVGTASPPWTASESLPGWSGRLRTKPASTFPAKGFKDALPQIREVLFLDTADFRLYNNAFILRRRLRYEHGFAAGPPEFVFKFRHPDLQKTAEMDLRPQIKTNYAIKFKAEALPLKDRIGGVRLLYSHNVEFSFSEESEVERTPMATLMRMFPLLRSLHASKTDTVKLVNHTAVEEVLLDIGRLNFGKGVKAKANVAVWRTRGDEKPLVGEFAFQCKFQRANERHAVAMKRGERFFLTLQNVAKDWVALGTTKTGWSIASRAIRPRPTSDGRTRSRAGSTESRAGQLAWGPLRPEHLHRHDDSLAGASAGRRPQSYLGHQLHDRGQRPERERGPPHLPGTHHQCGTRLRHGTVLPDRGPGRRVDASLALSVTVLLSAYVVRVPVVWRQAPITAALVIAAVLTRHSEMTAAEVGLRRVGEVMLGCVVGLSVTWLMEKIWVAVCDGVSG